MGNGSIRSRNTMSVVAAERLDCLLAVARVVNSSLELDEVLRLLLEQARTQLQAESGSVLLLERAEFRLKVVAADGPRAELSLGRFQAVGDGIAGWVAEHCEPLLLHGAPSDPRFRRLRTRRDVRDALCVPLISDSDLLGVICLSNRRSESPFSPDDLSLLIGIANQASLAIRNALSYEEVTRQRGTVERLLREVTRAQEEERGRIALLLHDGPAQTLFAALRNLEAARVAAGPGVGEIALQHLSAIEHTIRAAIDETRGVMIDLRPLALDEIGLLPALRSYAERFERRTGIRAGVRRIGRDRPLPTVLAAALYRVAQESLTNVWKHAAATETEVILELAEDSCLLEIHDNGRGFHCEDLALGAADSFGLQSLKDRTALMGGEFQIASRPGAGTRVRVSVPLAPVPESPGVLV